MTRFLHALRSDPNLRHYLLLYAVAALGIDFGHVHRVHRADTVLFSLASLHDWTPFFWEQDRIGQFVPLLTTWCSDPLATVLIQTWLTTLIGLAVPLLLAEAVYPHPAGRAAATLVNAAMLALAPDRLRENLLIECYYPQAIAFGCVGLLLLGRADRPRWWRYPAAAMCFVLAHWVYVGVSVFLMPLALGIAVIRPGAPLPGLREAFVRLVRYFPGWASLVLLGLGTGVGLSFMERAQAASPEFVRPTPQEALPRTEWLDSAWGYWQHIDRYAGAAAWENVLAGGAAIGLLGLLVLRRRPAYPVVTATAVLLLAGGTELAFISTRKWPALNDHHLRYVIGCIECAQLILGLFAVAPLAAWIAGRGRWLAFGIAAALLFVGATAQYGFPAPGNPRADLDVSVGAYTPELLAAKVDAVGGDYWIAWSAMFHANLADPGRPVPLYGLARRSSVLRPQWERTHPDGMRVGVPVANQHRAEFFEVAEMYGLSKPVLVETRGGLEVYFTRPNPRP